jgi:predicted transcriptional regulator of viral defense system
MLVWNPEQVIFTTRGYAQQEGLSLSAASGKLARLEKQKFLTRITKGIWANCQHPWFHPLAVTPYLIGNEQGYVSFLTALHLHELISQIPPNIQMASTGHGRRVKTPVGNYELFQIKPELMQEGIAWSETQIPYLMATPEKALLDTLYLATRKGKRFDRLPELSLNKSLFDKKEFYRLLESAALPKRIRSAMKNRADELLI